MPRRPHLSLLLIGVLVLGLVAGCGTSRAARVDPSARKACERFLSELPRHVADQRRVSVDRDQLTATYGKPAITVTCAATRPKQLVATSECQRVSGVDWFAPPDQIGRSAVATTLTTIGRRPRIQAQVPADYWPPNAVMVDLGGDVKAHLTKTVGCS